MTGPLAPLFAQARNGIYFDRFNTDGTISSLHTDARAALSVIERHAQEMEKALREIGAVRLPTGNPVGRDELRGCHKARIEMQGIARAALPAREEGATGE